MPGIHDILEQVRAREVEAADALTAARREAASILLRAEDEGRAAHEGIIRRAEEEARDTVARAKQEAGETSRGVVAESRRALEEADRRAETAFDTAVSRLLELFGAQAGL